MAAPTAPELTLYPAGDKALSYTFSSVSGQTYAASCTVANSATLVGSATVTTSNGIGTVSVTGLTNGITYSCKVTATNSGGSTPSLGVDGTPYGTPSAPTISSLAFSCGNGNYYVTATFAAPSDTGGGALTYSGTLKGTTTGSNGNTSYSQTKSASSAGSMTFQVTVSGNYAFTITGTNGGSLSANSTSTVSANTFNGCGGGV
jgi:titin